MTENRATNIRIPPDLKAAAAAKARSEYRTLTDVVVRALRAYVGAGPAAADVHAPAEPFGPFSPVPVLQPVSVGAEPRDCPHPKGRVLKGLCGACGQHVGGSQ